MERRSLWRSASASRVPQAWLIQSKASSLSCTSSNTRPSKYLSNLTQSISTVSLTIWNIRWSRMERQWCPPKSKALIKLALVATKGKTCKTWSRFQASICSSSSKWLGHRSEATVALVWIWVASLSTIDSHQAVKCLSTWISTTLTTRSFNVPQPTKFSKSNEWVSQTALASLYPLRLSPNKTKSNSNNSNNTRCRWSSNNSSSSKCKEMV